MTNELFHPDVPADAAGEPDAAVILAGSRILIRMDAGAPRLPRRGEAAADWSHVLRLGRLDDGACGAVEVAEETAVPGCEWRDLRPMLTALPEAERTAAARARELLNWRKRRRFCGLCGAVTTDSETECARVCASCGAAFFPVLAPAAIVLVTRGDRALLAHNARFANRIHGLIAGFVETGETVEECIRRELAEEVGIEAGEIRYFGSQSWPFPHSLMLGFSAAYRSGEIAPDGREIESAGWFRRDELPEIPAPGSIARALIDAWVAGRLY